MLRAVLVVLGLPYFVAAQSASCQSGFNWAFNSVNQSPCAVASALGGVCVGEPITLQPLPTGFVYSGPSVTNANSCRCSSVYYSLLSACATCQGRNFVRWSAYKTNCTTVYSQIFPQPIPVGVNVPHYAYLDVETADTFNVTLASTAGGVESTRLPSTPTGPNSIPTSPIASSGKKSNAGAIAGGVIGGVVGLAIIAGLIFWFLRRRRTRAKTSSQPSSPYDPVMASQAPVSYGDSTSYAGTPGLSGTPGKVYDPNDPSTFPTSDHNLSYNPYMPSPDPNQQPYATNLTPNYTGNSSQLPPTRPHYTGAPEL